MNEWSRERMSGHVNECVVTGRTGYRWALTAEFVIYFTRSFEIGPTSSIKITSELF